MADGALAHVDGLRATLAGVFEERGGPRHLVRVDVNDLGLGVDRRASPLGATVEARKHEGFLSQAEGDKVSFVDRISEMLNGPLMSFRTRSQHVFGERLTRVRYWPSRQSLLTRSDVARHSAGGIFAVLNRNQRLASHPVKHKKPALLAGLHDGIDGLAVVLQGDKHWS